MSDTFRKDARTSMLSLRSRLRRLVTDASQRWGRRWRPTPPSPHSRRWRKALLIPWTRLLGMVSTSMRVKNDHRLTFSYSGIQPDHDKSASQSMMDKTGRASDREVHGGSAESMYAYTQTPPHIDPLLTIIQWWQVQGCSWYEQAPLDVYQWSRQGRRSNGWRHQHWVWDWYRAT